MPEASFEQIAATPCACSQNWRLRNDPGDARPPRKTLRGVFIPLYPEASSLPSSLIVYGVSNVKPREGETLEPYLERLTDELVLAFVKQEFEAGRRPRRGSCHCLSAWIRNAAKPDNMGATRFGGTQHDELRVSVLCEKFWNAQPARVKAKTLREP